MSGGARTLALWGAFLGVQAIVLGTVFGGSWLELLLLPVASTGVFATAAVLLARRSRAPEADLDAARPVTEFSVATTFMALAIAAILLGLELGVWLVEVGCGMLVVAVAGLVRERRGERPARSTR